MDSPRTVEVAMLREQLADARRDRDAWRDQAQRLAIADQRERRPWWKRLAGSDTDQSPAGIIGLAARPRLMSRQATLPRVAKTVPVESPSSLLCRRRVFRGE